MTPEKGIGHDELVRQLDSDLSESDYKIPVLSAIREFKLLQLHRLRQTVKPNSVLTRLYDILELIYGAHENESLQINYRTLQDNVSLLDLSDISGILTRVTSEHSRLDDPSTQATLALLLASIRCARQLRGTPTLTEGSNEF